jgi:hypothetical protein
MISMNLTLSYEAAGPVELSTVILDKVLMSKTACNWSSDFHIPSMSTLFLFFFLSFMMGFYYMYMEIFC